MALYELTRDDLAEVPRTTMQEQFFREREDLQRLLKGRLSVLGDDLFVIDEEFSDWEDSRRRIDLLAVDRNGSLVVVELKRTEDGGHMDLQAIRYAAMVSTLRFDQALTAHAKFRGCDTAEAQASILEFLGVTEPPEDFGNSVRILLVSPDFSKELTTAVLWLNSNGLDIRCVRLRPYRLDDRTLLEIEQVIPIKEAQEYTVRVKEKQAESRQAAESVADFTRYDLTVNGQIFPNLWKRNLIWRVLKEAAIAGLPLGTLQSIIPARKIVIVDGHPRGDAFIEAAAKAKEATGYVFRPARMFIDDDHLIDVGDKTVAISNQWGLPSLPLIDQVIAAVPSANISYKRSQVAE
ncbi:MAG TPA: hypothetical protein VN678_11915 [Acidobacteriaceae bacterium]|nr:hypothetical protein [Acidobacteriaceae bacterium]